MADRLEDLRTALADRYEIEKEIGHGGMANVYLAKDLKHHREVAVKVLRPDLAAALGPERFLREIEIAANLTHPHILPLHDSGETDGFLYYVMPYIEGDTLRERIEKEGELPVAEAVRIIREVVDALAFAHSKGVVHRDIKPDNVMLSGRHAMVTDFGVAKAISEATGRNQLTTAGVALGTPAYMSPEQATADPHVDHRADIYAVGAMAYELLTGRVPFVGATPQAVLAAHVTEEPEPVSKYRDQVSGELEAVVMKCLAKKPADRWQSADEIMPYLDTVATSGSLTPTATVPLTAWVAHRRRPLVYSVTGALIALAAVGSWWITGKSSEFLVLGERHQVTRARGLEIDPAISPDGQRVVYAAGPRDRTHIYVRQVGGGRVLPLTEELEGRHRWPQWSPDGSRVLFTSSAEGDEINVVPALGGAVRRIAAGFGGATWSPDGREVGYLDGDTLYAVSSSGGTPPRAIASVPGGHSPDWSPDGSLIVLAQGNAAFVWATSTFGNIAPSAIVVVQVETGETFQVTPTDGSMAMSPVWIPAGGAILFVSDREGSRDIYQIMIDDRGRSVGDAHRLTVGANAHSVRLGANGLAMVYSEYTYSSNLWAYEVPRSGTLSTGDGQPVTSENQILEFGDVSPDGEWLVFDTDRFGNQDIFKMPIDGGDEIQLTHDPGDDFAPVWSPDGTEVAFYSMRHGTRDVFVMDADGSSLTRVTHDDIRQESYPRWSPDGNQLTYGGFGTAPGTNQVFIVARSGRSGLWGEPVVFSREAQTQDQFALNPSWSPDTGRIAYNREDGLVVAAVDHLDPTLIVGYEALPSGSLIQTVDWSAGLQTIFFKTLDPDGGAIWGISEKAAGGGSSDLARRYLLFDDDLLLPRHTFRVRGNKFYVTLGEHESDIWVMDLEP